MPWQETADARNRIVHGYFDVDFETIAAIVRDDIPPLLVELETLLAEGRA